MVSFPVTLSVCSSHQKDHSLQWAVTTSVNYSLAELIQVIILLSTGGKNGGGYEGSKYVVIAIHGGLLLVHAIINSLSISWLSFFGQLAAGWNILGRRNHTSKFAFNSIFPGNVLTGACMIVGVFVLMILVPCVATEKASAEFVFTHFNTENTDGVNGRLYIFLLGLLMSQYTLTGYDASAHMVSPASFLWPTQTPPCSATIHFSKLDSQKNCLHLYFPAMRTF